ncbi:hypothetical protein HDU97_000065 [Phlyctochytrium planicorne]|nr:hypothetical protein HDU97_000065 [Phlyctochytrium planicorne]
MLPADTIKATVLQMGGLINKGSEMQWTVFMHSVAPLLQHGPSCGLVALEMAIKYFGNDPYKSSRHLPALLDKAQKYGYSRKGEMFTAHDLASLASDDYGLGVDVKDWHETLNILDHINKGGLCMVAYDKDGNNEPCMKGGSKAHWALINGYVTGKPAETSSVVVNYYRSGEGEQPSLESGDSRLFIFSSGELLEFRKRRTIIGSSRVCLSRQWVD